MLHLFGFEPKQRKSSRNFLRKKYVHATGYALLSFCIFVSCQVTASESEALGDEVESSTVKTQKPEMVPETNGVPQKKQQKPSPDTNLVKDIESSDSSEIEIPQEPMAETLTPPTTVPDHNVIEEGPIVNIQTSAQAVPETKQAESASKNNQNDVQNLKLKDQESAAEIQAPSDQKTTTKSAQPKEAEEEVEKEKKKLPLNELPSDMMETDSSAEAQVTTEAPALEDSAPALQTTKPAKPKKAKPLTLLGTEIPPGMATRVAWRPGHTLKGLASQAPVLVVHGSKPGPTVCVTGAVHGDELNGIEVVRQVLHQVKASKLKGTLIGVPIVNIQGFLRNSRYLVDRRDLNRYFPGTEHGSLASRIAHSFFHKVILNCSALVDVHTGSFYRDNIPQLRADLRIPGVVEMTKGFGSTLVLQSGGADGTLRKAAVQHNIPAVTLELGGPMILDADAVEHGAEGIMNLLDALGMYKKNSFWGTPKPVYHQSLWVRAEHGGIFFSKVKLGDVVKPGDLLGTITNPITNEQYLLVSPYTGEVVGLANNQVVYPGFATTHLAFKTDQNLNIKGLSEHLDRE